MYRVHGISRYMRRHFIHSSVYRAEEVKQENVLSKPEITPSQPSPVLPGRTPTADTSEKPHLKTLLTPTVSPIQEIPLPRHSLTSADINAVLDVAKKQEQTLRMAASFDEMPGPKVLKYLARAWGYLPQFSNQFTAAAMVYFMNMLGSSLVWNRGVTPFLHMFDKYGPVVRLQGIFGGDIVFVARPEHIEAVYKEEGKYPLRSALDSLERYRADHRKQSVAGPFGMFGPDWESVRSKLEVPIMNSVNQYATQMETIADEFMGNLRNLLNRQEETPANFDQEIFKWAFENVALVSFGKRLHLVGEQKLLPGSVSLNLFESMQTASIALRKCESGFQMWRLLGTPSWGNLVTSCEMIDSIILKFIRETENNLQAKRLGLIPEDKPKLNLSKDEESASGDFDMKPPVSLLESLVADGGMSHEDILTVLLDMLLLGANATAHALSFLLYRMAKAPRVQRTLIDELKEVMPEPTTPLATADSREGIEELTYLKACLRESLRMNPPIPVLTRILPKDIALHNYRVPRGTVVLMTTHVAGMKEENFEDAKTFKPSRWLKPDAHPFASLPYGHGPRSCVARHLADVQILFLAAKIFRTYNVEYNYGVMHPTNRLISMPNKPLKFRFVERP